MPKKVEAPFGYTGFPRYGRLYVYSLAGSLALYACLGKGFAYLGFGGVYIGELLLALGTFVLVRSGGVAACTRRPLGVIALCFIFWNACCAVQYLGQYGLNVFRDSAIWGYSIFAWIAAAVIYRQPGIIQWVLQRYARFSSVYAIAGPAAWAATIYFASVLPHWKGSYITVPYLKTGDMCVHLAGICTFSICAKRGSATWALALAPVAVALGAVNRGGAAAALVGISVAALLRMRWQRILSVVLATALGAMVFVAVSPTMAVPITNRVVSAAALIRAAQSLFEDTNDATYDGTTEWRMRWWRKIVADTLYGPYFWSGRGYGINLAADDGVAADADLGLRSPHNSHLTFMARSGVPGELLWIAFQLAWCTTILRAYRRANRENRGAWAGLFAWVFAYWAAFMVNMAFDVSLEGPAIGIPYWTLFGFGWGSQMVYTSCGRRAASGRQSRRSAKSFDNLREELVAC